MHTDTTVEYIYMCLYINTKRNVRTTRGSPFHASSLSLPLTCGGWSPAWGSQSNHCTTPPRRIYLYLHYFWGVVCACVYSLIYLFIVYLFNLWACVSKQIKKYIHIYIHIHTYITHLILPHPTLMQGVILLPDAGGHNLLEAVAAVLLRSVIYVQCVVLCYVLFFFGGG